MKNQKLNFIYTLCRDFQKKKALEDGIRRSKENYRNKIGKFNLKNQLNNQEVFLKVKCMYIHSILCACLSMYVCIMHEQEPKQVRNPKRSKDTESSGTVNVN